MPILPEANRQRFGVESDSSSCTFTLTSSSEDSPGPFDQLPALPPPPDNVRPTPSLPGRGIAAAAAKEAVVINTPGGDADTVAAAAAAGRLEVAAAGRVVAAASRYRGTTCDRRDGDGRQHRPRQRHPHRCHCRKTTRGGQDWRRRRRRYSRPAARALRATPGGNDGAPPSESRREWWRG